MKKFARDMLIVGIIILVLFLISGCSAQTFKGQCAMQPVAQQGNVSYFNIHCMSEDSQK